MENAENKFIPTRDIGDAQRANNLLTATQLVEKTHEELKIKLNREIRVSKPPSLLLETQRVAEGEGFRFFDPIYFPKLSYTKLTLRHPEWVPLNWIWIGSDFEKENSPSNFTNPSRFGGFWALFDRTPRPSFKEGKQLFDNDEQLGSILARLRQEGKIRIQDSLRHMPETSRFAVSLDNVSRFVFPELSKHLRLEDKIEKKGVALIRTPKLMEFNFAGNLRYPYLGKADTWEWLYDTFDSRNWLVSGSSDPYSLSNEGYRYTQNLIARMSTGLAGGLTVPYERSSEKIAFRPMIIFGKDLFEMTPAYYRLIRQ